MSKANKDKRFEIRLSEKDFLRWSDFSRECGLMTVAEFVRESVEGNMIVLEKVKGLKGRKKVVYEGRSVIIEGQRYVLCSGEKYQNFVDYFKELRSGKKCRELEPGTTKADRLFREGGDLID